MYLTIATYIERLDEVAEGEIPLMNVVARRGNHLIAGVGSPS